MVKSGKIAAGESRCSGNRQAVVIKCDYATRKVASKDAHYDTMARSRFYGALRHASRCLRLALQLIRLRTGAYSDGIRSRNTVILFFSVPRLYLADNKITLLAWILLRRFLFSYKFSSRI